MSVSVRTDVRIPRDSVNDDIVRVVSWAAADGGRVVRGATIAEVDTSKATIDVAAEADGVLRILVAAQTDVPINQPIGFIESEANAASQPAVASPQVAAATSAIPPTTEASGPLVSLEARDLLSKHGLSVLDFPGVSMITGEMVRRRVGIVPSAPAGSPLPQSAPPNDDPSILFDRARERWGSKGRRGLLHDAADSAAQRGRGVVWLVVNYCWRNWLLGLLARVAPRGLDVVVHRLRGVTIGRACFIDPTAILETAFPEEIKIGNDVRVAARAVLMTHIKAPDLLRESGAVPVVKNGIQLCDHCFVGVNACIMPGVTVGEGAVVASGAVVLKDVPPYTMVAGNPAQHVKSLRPRG